MVVSPEKSRLRVVRVLYSSRNVSPDSLLSTGVVGSSTSFCALGIWLWSCTIGGWWRVSEVVNRVVRLVMVGEFGSTERGRDELEPETEVACGLGVSDVRMWCCEAIAAGTPEENRLTCEVLGPGTGGASLVAIMAESTVLAPNRYWSVVGPDTWTRSSPDSWSSIGG